MENERTFSLTYDQLYRSAENEIRDTLQIKHGPVMKDDLFRGELRGVIRLWDRAAMQTDRAELERYRDKRKLQKLAGLPEGGE